MKVQKMVILVLTGWGLGSVCLEITGSEIATLFISAPLAAYMGWKFDTWVASE